MPFHLQFKDCLFALQIPICSNVLYTALSPTGEHHRKQIPFSIQPGIFNCVSMCVARGLGAEANGRQEGICPPYFTVLFIHVRSKLTSSAGATGRVYSHLNLEEFTTLDTACVSMQGNTPASCTTAIMLLNLLHGISTVTAWVYISCKAKPLTIFS